MVYESDFGRKYGLALVAPARACLPPPASEKIRGKVVEPMAQQARLAYATRREELSEQRALGAAAASGGKRPGRVRRK
jgi:hypothetical protein